MNLVNAVQKHFLNKAELYGFKVIEQKEESVFEKMVFRGGKLLLIFSFDVRECEFNVILILIEDGVAPNMHSENAVNARFYLEQVEDGRELVDKIFESPSDLDGCLSEFSKYFVQNVGLFTEPRQSEFWTAMKKQDDYMRKQEELFEKSLGDGC